MNSVSAGPEQQTAGSSNDAVPGSSQGQADVPVVPFGLDLYYWGQEQPTAGKIIKYSPLVNLYEMDIINTYIPFGHHVHIISTALYYYCSIILASSFRPQ